MNAQTSNLVEMAALRFAQMGVQDLTAVEYIVRRLRVGFEEFRSASQEEAVSALCERFGLQGQAGPLRKVVIETRGNDMDPAYDFDPFVAYVVEAPQFVWTGGGKGIGEDCTARTREDAVEQVRASISGRYPHLSFSFCEEHRA